MILAYYTSVCLACWSWVALLAFRGACLGVWMGGVLCIYADLSA